MGRLLLLSTTTGYQAGQFRAAAERMGVPLGLATDRCHVLEDPWRDGALAVRFERPRESAHIICEYARQQPLRGIVAIGDAPTMAAALACHELKIDWHPPAAVEASRNKFVARERFKAAGMRVPWYSRFPAESDARIAAAAVPYPCVLKPLGLSASRGVIRANGATEFVRAFERVRALLDAKEVRALRDAGSRWIQVEGYIPGREFAIEGILTRGVLRVLAIFDKPDPLDGPFFEETIYVTPSRLPEGDQQSLLQCVQQGVAALGLWHGPIHAEVRLNDAGPWMLEIAARPIGGLCAGALRFERSGDTIGLEELILRHAAGEDVSGIPRESAASGVMMIPIPEAGVYEGVKGVEQALDLPGVERIEITAKLREKLVPLPEGASYLGFIFARGASPAFVEDALRAAHQKLQFVISPSLPLMSATPVSSS